MNDEKAAGAAVNYGGMVSDLPGRPAGAKADDSARDGLPTVSEQLDRILPKEG